MDELLERLTASLEGRYEILREAGRGGMAVVFLAKDLRHKRQVAIKVFRPELANQAEAGRFLREIEVAARLSHPNILALYDSGDADGLPYYVMPFVDGESLATRIYRDGELPIHEAVRITRLVAAALQHAHSQGIVHRDIKPDNIMLAGESVLVADFGIAHAVNTIGNERLTATGLSVGTPTFMSPEQITGSAKLDGRADIYSLGCVLYTMLLGVPPFSGQSVQAILARHLAEPVPNLRVVRATIPRAVEGVVHRALAKAPVDRFATAGEMADALAPEQITDEAMPRLPGHRIRRRWLLAGGVVATVAAAVLWLRPWSLTRRPHSPAGRLDPHLIAVAPFGMNAVGEPGMDDLGHQLPALVQQRLPGDGGPQAVVVGAGDSPTSAAAARLGRSAGAGLLLIGNVAMVSGRLTFTATLRDLRNDSVVSRVDGISGPPDSLPALVDRLVAVALIDQLGVAPQQRLALASLPLAALRQYLGAIALFKHGEWFKAGEGFKAVLSTDSTCYPAALWGASVAMMQLDAGAARRPLALARAQLGRMSDADTLQLHSLSITREDGVTRLSVAERLRNLDDAASSPSSSSPRSWYLLGERLFHDGPLLGIKDMLRMAARSFDHVVEADPEYLPALGHSIDLAAAAGDTAKVRRLGALYFSLDSVGDLSDFYHWRVAIALGDPRELERVRARMDRFSPASLEQVVNVAQLDGEGISDAANAARTLWAQSGAGNQARWAFTKQRELALNRGRPSEATALLAQWQRTGAPFRPREGMAEVVNALFWGADTSFPAAWVDEQVKLLGRPPRGPVIRTPEDEDNIRCGTSLWLALRGRGPIAESEIPILRPSKADSREGDDAPLCRATVEASLAWRNHGRDPMTDLERLDSLVASVPSVTTWLLAAANLTAARLWEAEGDLDRALVAVRRRPYITDVNEPRVLVGLSTMLREEGRLAAITGDTAGAITAYRRYLALRDDPEPAVTGEVAEVRTDLARLGRR